MPMDQSSMMHPEIEELTARVGSKFGISTLAATRAREINSYFGQLGDGVGAKVPPQVTSVSRKPLSIAFEEIAADKIIPVVVDPEAEAAAEAEAEAAAAVAVDGITEAELTAITGGADAAGSGDEPA